MPTSVYSASSRSVSMSRSSRHSVSSGSSTGSSKGSRGSVGSLTVANSSVYGGRPLSHRPRTASSSFLVGRERAPSAENELFSRTRKPRSTYRRPSSLGLARAPLLAATEARTQYKPLPASRSHIVAKTPDSLRPEGSFVKDTEVKSSYKNFNPTRPVIKRIPDHLKPEGNFENRTETKHQYENKNPTRPVIFRLKDHDEQVQPKGQMDANTEYRNNYAKAMKGERVLPSWINKFEKVTIDGSDTAAR